MDHDREQLPWTEEQWEAHLKRSELRAARFGELLETLKDDPDMDAKINREMGWALLGRPAHQDADAPEGAYDDTGFIGEAWSGGEGADDSASGSSPEAPFADDEVTSPFATEPGAIEAEPEVYEDYDAALNPQDDGPELMRFEDAGGDADEIVAIASLGGNEPMSFDLDGDDVKEIDAYRKSLSAALRIHESLKSELEKPTDLGDEEIGEAFLNAHIACARIAGGHGMGYEDDVLCGNIVCNKIALAANKRCEKALLSLRDRKVIPPDIIDPLLPGLLEARTAIEQRIAELRSKVWWDKR